MFCQLNNQCRGVKGFWSLLSSMLLCQASGQRHVYISTCTACSSTIDNNWKHRLLKQISLTVHFVPTDTQRGKYLRRKTRCTETGALELVGWGQGPWLCLVELPVDTLYPSRASGKIALIVRLLCHTGSVIYCTIVRRGLDSPISSLYLVQVSRDRL